MIDNPSVRSLITVFLTDARVIIRDKVTVMPTAATVQARVWVLPDEPLPVRLMSTVWAGADGLHDDFATAADVDAWLDAAGLGRAGTRTTAVELAAARALRDAVRRLAAYLTEDAREAAAIPLSSVEEAVTRLNATAAALPAPSLTLRAGRLEPGLSGAGSPVTAALAEVAARAAELLGGPEAGRLRACYAPGCVLYFVAAHPRRAWCSVACGNRARAARHYQKVREDRGGATPAR
jgi:predicted RNA-binding Zn ribbon-like protein